MKNLIKKYCPHSLFQATNGDIYIGIYNNGLYKSTDNGETWVKLDACKGYADNIFQSFNGDMYVVISEDITSSFYWNLYKSTDNGETWTKMVKDRYVISWLQTASGVIYSATTDGLYKSTDNGETWTKIVNDIHFHSLLQITNGDIYCAGWRGFFYIISEDKLFKCHNQGKRSLREQIVIFDKKTMLDVKSKYLASATWDGEGLSLPEENKPIPADGKIHTLVMTLNDQFVMAYNNVFGGNSKFIKKRFWVKSGINQAKIKFNANKDTNCYNALVSNLGNTNGWAIIQTEVKTPVVKHPATLYLTLTSKYLFWSNCYWERGVIDSRNNWHGHNQKLQVLFKTNWNNGLYHLHLQDVVGNNYDAVLEIGRNNWKSRGNINNEQINKLRTKLHVTVRVSSSTKKEKIKILSWLKQENQYINEQINNAIVQLIASDGGGFIYIGFQDSWIQYGFLNYLNGLVIDNADHLPEYEGVLQLESFKIYVKQQINTCKSKFIYDGVAEQKVKANWLRVNLETPASIRNKIELNKYQKFIATYYKYLVSRFDKLLSAAITKIGLGYLTRDQINNFEGKFTFQNLHDYLIVFNWCPHSVHEINNDEFLKHINLKQFYSSAQKWVNDNIHPTPQEQLKTDIYKAVNQCNLHGSNLFALLRYGHKIKPVNRGQIINFDGHGLSFKIWLQKTADKYLNSQKTKQIFKILAVSFGGTFGLAVIVAAVILWYRTWIRGRLKTNKKTGKIIVPPHLKAQGWDTIENLTIKSKKNSDK